MDKPKEHTERFLRERKMLLVAPLVVVAMLSLAFYGLGGGKGGKRTAATGAAQKGLNTTLPPAHFDKKERAMDKLGFYQKAELDSEKMAQRMKQDPYYTRRGLPAPGRPDSLRLMTGSPAGRGNAGQALAPLSKNAAEEQADKVMERLEELKKALPQPGALAKTPGYSSGMDMSYSPKGAGASPELSGLEREMQALHRADTLPHDPEMDRLSGMLDKIIRIQHPGEANAGDSGRLTGSRDALVLHSARRELPVGTLGNEAGGSATTGFIDIGEKDVDGMAETGTLSAVIDRDQTLVSGAVVGLRLSEDADINGVHIPSGNLFWGKSSLSGERLMVTVSSIRYGNGLYPVALQVYDLDGLVGIRIPGAISRDVSKESADEAISSIGLTTLDPSLGAQAAGAGIQAAKTLLSRKIKLVRVTLKAGYRVLLKNTKNDNH